MSDLLSKPTTPKSNVPELSVSELAFSLKKTLEETYGRVRIRGELSRVKVVGSGHMYSDLKDENAVINVICWKGTLSKLAIKPEEGLEVICTGKITTYPARSNYQMIIESMELAGEGALLKMLEERRKKLTAEGLFADDRKKPLPFLPQTVGVITSATGAVLRDIMHRLNDRFPRHVLLWPVLVQGQGAAQQITDAINGFDALPKDGTTPRPDLLIVGRGGGSLEDLMAFNEENVVRAVAACSIPVISAVGHETDTTLIDYAADRRAPTPTAAAEMAVPRRIDLMARMQENQQRLLHSSTRMLNDKRHKLEAHAARLGDPRQLLNIWTQKLDHAVLNLSSRFEQLCAAKKNKLARLEGQIRHPQSLLGEAQRTLAYHSEHLDRVSERLLAEPQRRIDLASRMLETLSFQSVLQRGFVLVRDENGHAITEANQTKQGQNIQLQFKNDENIDAIIGKSDQKSSKPTKKHKKSTSDDQQQLF